MLISNSIHFSYPKGPEVIRGIDCQVREGEILGILGPNGSGKTTFLHLLAGLYVPQAGEVRLNGRDLKSYSCRDIAQHVSLVEQSHEIRLPFSVWDVVLMGRQAYQPWFGFDSREDRRIAEEALVATNTHPLRHRVITELSGGEQRRVLIARALAQNTPVMIYDEPTSQLDIRYQLEICELLQRLRDKQCRSIIVTLHDINLAALYCDRLLLLQEGTVVSQGTPQEVITSENLAGVYGVRVSVDTDAASDRPFFRLHRQ